MAVQNTGARATSDASLANVFFVVSRSNRSLPSAFIQGKTPLSACSLREDHQFYKRRMLIRTAL